MSLLRTFSSYYRANYRFLGASQTYLRYQDLPHRNQWFTLLDQRRSSSSESQHNGAEISSAAGANEGAMGPTPPSDGPPIVTWAKVAIGSIVTILIPFLYTQWKAMQKIEGEIDAAKQAAEKTAETVEKVAEMAEKASKEAADQLKDGKLKEAAEVAEKVSKIVEEDARLVDDILHKVDDIEEDVKTLVEPITKPSKTDDKNKHEEKKLEEHLN
ncbi:hypothetical protein LUZ61_006309 [Rhynchospora tenuis]|uniref:Uncharacterized protein n=1 Tax=Rhynchospora tenuis TaxID=198213 RepID=A0AAD5ZR78_9POAL|nr:hypothetical protein LUZ61_006309 [Rhynchospora tenuis]